MNHQILFKGLFGFGLALFAMSKTYAQDPKLTAADAAYQSGDCAAAVSGYQAILSSMPSQAEGVTQILFRKSYCELNLNRPADASKGFAQVIKAEPNFVEARIRYAQAAIQLQKEPQALKALAGIKEPGNWLPEVEYWKGVAYSNTQDWDRSKASFQICIDKSPSDIWTKKACTDWLAQLNQAPADPFFYLRLGGGGLYDGNVGQASTTYSTISSSGPGSAPTETVDASAVSKSAGYSGRAGLDLNWVRGKSFRLSTSLDFSITKYLSQTTYNNEYISASLNPSFKLSDDYTLLFPVWFGESLYSFKKYQDTLGSSPSLYMVLDKDSSLTLASDISAIINSVQTKTVGVRASYFQALGKQTYTLGASASRTFGTAATITGTPPSLQSGYLFNNYWYAGVTANYVWSAGWKVFVTPAISLGMTLYDQETMPSTPGSSTTSGPGGSQPPGGGSGPGGGGRRIAAAGAAQQSARSDITFTPGLTISRSLFFESLTLSITGRYTINKSSGFQGLASSYGTISSNSYNRPYVATDLAWWF